MTETLNTRPNVNILTPPTEQTTCPLAPPNVKPPSIHGVHAHYQAKKTLSGGNTVTQKHYQVETKHYQVETRSGKHMIKTLGNATDNVQVLTRL